jgi:hypothetical protein
MKRVLRKPNFPSLLSKMSKAAATLWNPTELCNHRYSSPFYQSLLRLNSSTHFSETKMSPILLPYLRQRNDW